MRLLPAAKPVPAASPWIIVTTSYDSLFFPEKPSGIGSGAAWDLPSRKNLRFVREGLQCCRGVKQRRLGRKTRSLCSGDCSHLGRQTESESSPLTPKTSLSKKKIPSAIVNLRILQDTFLLDESSAAVVNRN